MKVRFNPIESLLSSNCNNLSVQLQAYFHLIARYIPHNRMELLYDHPVNLSLGDQAWAIGLLIGLPEQLFRLGETGAAVAMVQL